MDNNCLARPSMPATAGAQPIENAVLAMAYVPMQDFGALYDEGDALSAGTLFPELDKPFCGKEAAR